MLQFDSICIPFISIFNSLHIEYLWWLNKKKERKKQKSSWKHYLHYVANTFLQNEKQVKIWVLRFGEDTRWFPSIKYISFRIFKLLTSFNEFQQPHSRIKVYPMVLTFDISGQRFPITKPPLHVNPSHHCRDQTFERSGVSFSIANQVRLFKRPSRLQVVTWHRCACWDACRWGRMCV